jgi:hypothetical protein
MPPIDWTHIVLVAAGAIAHFVYSRFSSAPAQPTQKPDVPAVPPDADLMNLLAAIIHKLVEQQNGSPPSPPK